MRIPVARFILKDPKAEKPTLIFLVLRFRNKKMVYSTGESIHPDYWNPEDQEATHVRKYPEHGDINFNIDVLGKRAVKIFRDMVIDEILPTCIFLPITDTDS